MDKIIVRETSPNVFVELPKYQSIVGANDVLHPWQITELWTDAELAALNIFRAEPAAIPEGKVGTGFHYERVNGVVTQVVSLVSPGTLPHVVRTVSPRQIRLALSALGLRQAVEDYVQSQDITVKDSWEYTTEFLENNPLVTGAVAALGKTTADLHALFDLALTL